MRNYKNIKAWQLGDDLTVAVYEATHRFPHREMYGLSSQLRRASYSGPSNIAEGASRLSKKDYLHFLYIARGSIAETEYFLHLSRRLGYLDDEAYRKTDAMAKETQACLCGLIQAVERDAGTLRRTAAQITSTLALVLSTALWRLSPSL